jgi:glyoxylase-like metal-dependent hydrolase (beta-lactamase superfamily II)
MRWNGLDIALISDGIVHVDAGGPFGLVPRALYGRYFQPDAQNRVPMILLSLLIREDGRVILVDTGLGDKMSDEEASLWHLQRQGGGLLDGLKRLGLNPEDVDLVVNTHLHADHCGGNTRKGTVGLVPTFAHATYLVQRVEWSQARNPDVRTRNTYLGSNIQPLEEAGQLRLLHGETELTPHVRLVPTPGHTAGHQSVILRGEERWAMFVGDLASYAVHMERPAWVTAFDVDPLGNLETKARWRRWAQQQGAWLFFEHDPYRPVARFVRRGDSWRLEPVAEAEALIASLPTPPPPGG